ncbi:MAG: outer membrane beta-barrel protein, partial [Gammaproteobacteria bacterium]|nr:outer membrane beta-barrel protein [Gammaproteobacteria bacterium]
MKCALVFLCLSALFLLGYSSVALAEFGSGKVRFTPTLNLGFKYDDNIHLQEDTRKSSMVSELRSQMKVTVDNQINLTSIGYSGQYSIYHSSASDSRLDHMFFGKVHHEVLRNLTFDIGGAYQIAHEQRGAFYTVGPESSLLKPDGFRVKQFNGLFVLGTGESKGRLELSGNQKYLDFVSRKNVTANRNYESRSGGVTFIRNISPKTAVTLTGSYGTIDYISETPGIEGRSSVDQRYLLGARWEVSRLSIGEAKLGLRRKTFISDVRANANGFDWSLAMNWTPLRMLEFNIQSRGSFDESTGLSDYVDSKDLALATKYT